MSTSTIKIAFVTFLLAAATASAGPLPQLQSSRVVPAAPNGWEAILQGCGWYCGAPRIDVSASSSLSERKGLKHSPSRSHDAKMTTAWSEGVTGNGIGESLTYTFITTEKDTTGLGVTSCGIAIGHQASEQLFRQNARPRQIELRIDGVPKAILNLEDRMGLQEFEIPKLALGRPSKHTITLKILKVFPGTKFQDTCIADVCFDGTGRMH